MVDRDAGAAFWDERYAGSERYWSAEPNQFVEAHLGDLEPGRAVDLAAGEGRNAVWLARKGWRVTAIDFSRVGIDRGRAEEPGVEWWVEDVTTTDLPPVDLVLISYLHLPHEQMSGVVARSWTALAPGGTFFLVGHDASNITDGVGGPQDPSILSTADDVRRWLPAEAHVEVAERVERYTGAGTAYDVLVRATKR